MIDVEQRALRALEQHRRAALDRAMHHEPDVVGEREQSPREPLEHRDASHSTSHALRGCRSAASCAFACSAPASTSSRSRARMPQVEHAHAAPRDLVLVRRADAAARRADRLARRALAVDELVIRQHEMRAVAHVESPLDVDAVADELVDLGEQRLGIEHDAVADRAAHARVQNAARNLVQHERRVADVDRVAGVRAALIAHDPIGALGEDVDELALPLVAPLRADDDDCTRGTG